MGVYTQSARRQHPGLHGAALAGLARELRRNAEARRAYRQQVLGIQNVNQATGDQLALARQHGVIGSYGPHATAPEVDPGKGIGTFDGSPLAGPGLANVPPAGLATVLDAAAGGKPLMAGGPAGGRPVVGGPAMAAPGAVMGPVMSGQYLTPGPGMAGGFRGLGAPSGLAATLLGGRRRGGKRPY